MSDKQKFLSDYLKISDIHAQRLSLALTASSKLFPLLGESISKLTVHELGHLELFTSRFGKLQDSLGTKVLPLMLDILGETAVTFIDKLHKLEKIELIQSADWWKDIRELRNELTHDYPDGDEKVAERLNKLRPYAEDFLKEYEHLKAKFAKMNVNP